MVKIIAEAGVNHEGNIWRLKKLFGIARSAGADIFKLQHFKKGLKGPKRELPHLSIEHIIRAKGWCVENDMEFLCTPHDMWGLEELEKANVCDRYKVGSGNWDLIPALFETGKPLIVSTGMHTKGDVERLADDLNPATDVIMECTSEYPTPPERVRLNAIDSIKNVWLGEIGFSDHTVGSTIPLAAVGRGYDYVEKHISLELNVKGKQDTFCSLDYKGFNKFVEEARIIERACTPKKKELTMGELETLKWVRRRNAEYTG